MLLDKVNTNFFVILSAVTEASTIRFAMRPVRRKKSTLHNMLVASKNPHSTEDTHRVTETSVQQCTYCNYLSTYKLNILHRSAPNFRAQLNSLFTETAGRLKLTDRLTLLIEIFCLMCYQAFDKPTLWACLGDDCRYFQGVKLLLTD